MKTPRQGPDRPAFRRFRLNDVNPVSGQEKVRLISDPNNAMRALHRQMIGRVRGLGVPMPSSTAGFEGQSAFRNVLRHRKRGSKGFNRYLVLLDISSAYQAVRIDRMVEVLVAADPAAKGGERVLYDLLARNFFDDRVGGLVTGGPASPDLFNLYCEFLIDRDIRALCERYGLTYTRYIDDLTLSSRKPIGAKKRRAIRAVIEAAGFRVSDRKAKVYDLRKGPVAVNGVGVTLEGRVFLPRRTLRHVKGLIHRALTVGDVPAALVHGKMGLLKAVTWLSGANRTEEKVFEMYARFKQAGAQ